MEKQHFYKKESETKRSRRLNVSNICIISEWQLHPEKSSLVNRCISGPQRVLWMGGQLEECVCCGSDAGMG